MSSKVLIAGGRGFFGQLLVEDLRHEGITDVLIASRYPLHSDKFHSVVADLRDPASLERALDGVMVAICAAGPFQDLPPTLAQLCLQRGIHYIDLADDRGFVRKIRSLSANHQESSSVVCTGWSTVSALSGMLCGIASRGMTAIDSIRVQMAPGNRGARQVATITSLLHSVGQPVDIFRNGAWCREYGWSSPRDFAFPAPVGIRRGYLVDVPDHEIFPELFNARTVEFRAGSELQLLNGVLSFLRRTRQNLVPWSKVLQRCAAWLSWAGHDWGAIGVEVMGTLPRRACLVANSVAERMAAMPASIMTRALLSGTPLRGLISYKDWLTEEQFRLECGKRNFRLVVEDL